MFGPPDNKSLKLPLYYNDLASNMNSEDFIVADQARRMPALTGLRGVASVWVVTYHIFTGYHVPFIDNGYAGVDIFFILSGYVLSYVYISDNIFSRKDGYIRFLIIRLTRIYPLHLFSLFLMLMIVLFIPRFTISYPNYHEKFGLYSFLSNLFLIQNWIPRYVSSWDGPSWSLSAEWFAYIWFPFVLFFLKKIQSRRVLISFSLVSISALIIILYVEGYHNTTPLGLAGMARLCCEFAAGCFLYGAVYRGFYMIDISIYLFFSMVICLVLPIKFLEFGSIFCFLFLIATAGQDNTTITKILSIKPLLFLGEISFSLYLVHWPIIQCLNYLYRTGIHFNIYERFLIVSIASLGLSILSYHFIEKPARSWGRKIAKWNKKPAMGQRADILKNSPSGGM